MATRNLRFYGCPTAAEAELAAMVSRVLATCSGAGETATLRIIENGIDLKVPITAIRMLADILDQMALGNTISIVPTLTELTTQEAADMLNVSRPYLIRQILSQGNLPFHYAGNRRKILFKDVVIYKRREAEETDQIMTELASLSQSLDMLDR